MHPSYIPCSCIGVETRQTLYVDMRCNRRHVCGAGMGTEINEETERSVEQTEKNKGRKETDERT
jgi:hypothetical protein